MTGSYLYSDPLSEHVHVYDHIYTFEELLQGVVKWSQSWWVSTLDGWSSDT
jgi:hypothetical protein